MKKQENLTHTQWKGNQSTEINPKNLQQLDISDSKESVKSQEDQVKRNKEQILRGFC